MAFECWLSGQCAGTAIGSRNSGNPPVDLNLVRRVLKFPCVGKTEVMLLMNVCVPHVTSDYGFIGSGQNLDQAESVCIETQGLIFEWKWFRLVCEWSLLPCMSWFDGINCGMNMHRGLAIMVP